MMTQFKVFTVDDFNYYFDRGYTESLEDIGYLLSTSEGKTRQMLKHAPRMEVTESLYSKIKLNGMRKNRHYYNQDKTIKHLIENDWLHISYYDPFDDFFKKGNKESEIDIQYLLNNVWTVKLLLGASRTINDIIISDLGYHKLTDPYDDKAIKYVKADDLTDDTIDTGELYNSRVSKEEIYSKSEYVKYINLIKRGFYIKLKLGKSNFKYIHSRHLLKEYGISQEVKDWAKEGIPNNKW